MSTNGDQGSSAPPNTLRRRGFLGFLMGGLAAMAAGRLGSDNAEAAVVRPVTGQPWILGTLNSETQQTGLISPTPSATLEIGNIGNGRGVVATVGSQIFPPESVTVTGSVLGWDNRPTEGIGGGFFKDPSDHGQSIGVLGGLGISSGSWQAARFPARAGGVFLAADGLISAPPSAVTTTASVLGWNLSAAPGLGAGFFKEPPAPNSGPAPNMGMVVALSSAEDVSALSNAPLDAGGVFVAGPAGGLIGSTVTVTAGTITYSESQVASQAMTETGTAMVAQVLGSGTAVHAVQESPAGDAVSISGRLRLNRCYQVTVPTGADTFTIQDPFVTEMTVAIANFTNDPRNIAIKMVTPHPGAAITIALTRRAPRPLTLNVALIC